MPRSLRRALGIVLAALLLLAGCRGSLDAGHGVSRPVPPAGPTADSHAYGAAEGEQAHGVVTLAFAGDLHFQLQLAVLLEHPRGALGPIAETLKAADVTMVNLESAITTRGTLEAKELEERSERYYFRTSPAVLRVLAGAGIDVATMANNHGADYGPVGLADTLRAIRRGPVSVVGVGRNRVEAFAPHLVSVRGTHIAFLAGDASMREGSSSVWEAGPTSAGIAAAHEAHPRAILAAVRKAADTADVVVVYMHWGEEGHGCPTQRQRTLARLLAEAGADVVVGSHAHLLQGAGWLGRTYVGYGLGNFVWYHDRQPETGVLTLRIRDGAVVADEWTPARIHDDGVPVPLSRRTRSAAVAAWDRLRGCTDLAASPPETYRTSVQRIGPELRDRLSASHRRGCPVALGDLRYLRVSYLGFDGRPHTGELVVHERWAADIAQVFLQLFEARWPIARMRLVDVYDGDDDRSMAADNTSAYNCRTVAGSEHWSAHAYGAAVDLNPVQNPDLRGSSVRPRAAAPYALLDRSASAEVPAGAIRADDLVVRSFAAIGWEWGGAWSGNKDYQHFSAPAGSWDR